MGEEIKIRASDGSGSFMAYVAKPASGTGPGIVVIQEIFGVNTDVRAKCDAWAEQGYIAMAPDIFWRQMPGVQLNRLDEAEWQQAFGLYQGLDFAKAVEDLRASIDWLRANSSGKVGTVGYCLGGNLAYRCATSTDADASVGYYGVGIESLLGQAASIQAPLILHIATADQFVPPDAQAQIHAALKDRPQVTLYEYAGQQHAFSRLGGEHYHEASATLAHARTAALFDRALKRA